MIRLLKFNESGELSFEEYSAEDAPKYAILSHTWGAGADEVTYKDVLDGSGKDKNGYTKLLFCATQAQVAGLDHFWVDTCCIDKSNLVELVEAITSMFRWYKDAARCFVYLSDVSVYDGGGDREQKSWELKFRKSRWFKRGWTLQELIAPSTVEFFSSEGISLGDRKQLEQQIHEVTEIPLEALRGTPPSVFSVDERKRWAAKRVTKKKEDRAYCLFGIFDVYLPLIYGEGDNAFRRLEEEVEKRLQTGSHGTDRRVFIVPFRQDVYFVERKILNSIWEHLLEPAARIGIVGLGGVGKTQLAIECAYRIHKQDHNRSVFWVHASNAGRFRDGYQEIAERLKLCDSNNPKLDVLAVVHRWLSDETNGTWTMIVDNADDPDVLFGDEDGKNSDSKCLSDYLPTSANGSIIITSRYRKVFEGLIDYERDIFDVKPMSSEESLLLIERRLKDTGQEQDVEILHDLVQHLDHVPLAISQAAAYINQRAPRMTASMYLDMVRKENDELTKLLTTALRDPRRDGKASNSIIATWSISFEYLRRKHNSAARLLALMSQFDREAITDDLLRDQYFHDESAIADFDEDIAKLTAYHVIGLGTLTNSFNMHRLVQFSVKKWLEIHDELSKYQSRCVEILQIEFPAVAEFKNWPTCQKLLSHVEATLQFQLSSEKHLLSLARVQYRGGMFAYQVARYKIGEKIMRASLESRKLLLQPNSIEIAVSKNGLARIMRDQGSYEQAEELYQKAHAIFEMVQGPEGVYTLMNLGELAEILRQRGVIEETDIEEAEKLFRYVVEKEESLFGSDYPNLWTNLSNFALLLHRQNKYQEAEKLYLRCLQKSELLWGPDHPNTLTDLHNVASVLASQQKYGQAEPIFRLVLTKRENMMGKDHPKTLSTMAELAGCLLAIQEYDEAIELSYRTLKIQTSVLGNSHRNTLACVHNLACALRQKMKYEEALPLSRRAAEGSMLILGNNNLSTMHAMNGLACNLLELKKYDEALALFDRVVDDKIRFLGEDDESTLRSAYDLAQRSP